MRKKLSIMLMAIFILSCSKRENYKDSYKDSVIKNIKQFHKNCKTKVKAKYKTDTFWTSHEIIFTCDEHVLELKENETD